MGQRPSHLTSPLALAGLATGALLSSANESVNLVFGVWMENNFNLKITSLGLTSLALGLAEFGGESLAGVFTDRIGKVRSVAIL